MRLRLSLDAVGHSRNGIASLATPTVIARAGASASHTSTAGSSLVQGVAGIVYEEQIVSLAYGWRCIWIF